MLFLKLKAGVIPIEKLLIFLTGQIQSIQLSNGQNILAQNIQAGGGASGSPGASNLLQNLQQVQFITSTGQIIARTIPGNAKTTMANLSGRGINPTGGGDEGKGSVLKTSMTTTVRNTISNIQMASPKTSGVKNLKNVRIVSINFPNLRKGIFNKNCPNAR